MRLGIIGSNFIGHHLMEAAADLKGEVVGWAVLSRTEEAGRAFAARYPGMRVYTEREAFFQSGIEAVYVASPNFLHCEGAVAALDAGLHVLCEKPLCTDLWQAKEMFAAADRAGKVLMEAMRPAHDPGWEEVRRALPRIGTLRRVTLEYCQYSSRYDKFLQGEILNAFNPALSNAAIMDIGVYPLHVLGMLFGLPKSVQASSLFLHNGFEGAGSVLLEYAGMTAQVMYSKIADSVTPSVLLGEQGSITVDKISSPAKILLRTRKGEEELLPVRERDNNMDYELRDFLSLCASCDAAVARGEKKPQNPYREWSLREMALLDAIREKAGVSFTK